MLPVSPQGFQSWAGNSPGSGAHLGSLPWYTAHWAWCPKAEAEAGGGSQMWISSPFVSGSGNKVWVTRNRWGWPARDFHLPPPSPWVGGSRPPCLQVLLVPTAPPWPSPPKAPFSTPTPWRFRPGGFLVPSSVPSFILPPRTYIINLKVFCFMPVPWALRAPVHSLHPQTMQVH